MVFDKIILASDEEASLINISVSAGRSTTRLLCFHIQEGYCMHSNRRGLMLPLLPSRQLPTSQQRILTNSASGQCLLPRSVMLLNHTLSLFTFFMKKKKNTGFVSCSGWVVPCFYPSVALKGD